MCMYIGDVMRYVDASHNHVDATIPIHVHVDAHVDAVPRQHGVTQY